MLRNKKVLVTGAQGFIGKHLVQQLKREGAVIFSLDRRRNPDLNIQSYISDITDKDRVGSIVSEIRPELIFHFAGSTLKDASEEDLMRLNHLATAHFLDALTPIDYELFVFPSTSSVYGNTPSFPISESADVQACTPYGKSKAEAEGRCLQHMAQGKPIVIVRPFTVYGPGQENGTTFIPTLVRALKSGSQLHMYGGDQTRDYLYINDLIDFLMKVAKSDVRREILNCGTGRGTSIRDVESMVCSALGYTSKGIVYHALRGSDFLYQSADMSKVRTLLDWQAKMSLEEGLKETFGLH